MDSKISRKKKCTEPMVRANDEQIKWLIDYMERHKDFAAGRFIGVQGKMKLNSQWQNLTNSLNEIGPTKSAEKWKNVWKNQKSLARKKSRDLHISQRQTGNMSPTSELEENEVAVLNIIGKETSIGFGLNEGFEHFSEMYTEQNDHSISEIMMLDKEMNEELSTEILNENNELFENCSQSNQVHPSTVTNRTADISIDSNRRSNRDVPTMSSNAKRPKLDHYIDLVKGTNDGFIALASSLDKLATAIENSGEVINRGLMKIADAISNYK